MLFYAIDGPAEYTLPENRSHLSLLSSEQEINMDNMSFALLCLGIGFLLMPVITDKLKAPLQKMIAEINKRRKSIVDQKKRQKLHESLWREANSLMCTLPSADTIVDEVTLRTISWPEAKSKNFIQDAKKCAAAIHRTQAKFGRLKKRASTHPPNLPVTTGQVDELKRLNERMKARIQDVQYLYRRIDRCLIKH